MRRDADLDSLRESVRELEKSIHARNLSDQEARHELQTLFSDGVRDVQSAVDKLEAKLEGRATQGYVWATAFGVITGAAAVAAGVALIIRSVPFASGGS